MQDKKSEQLLGEFLKDQGFKVERIPRSNDERRPDFIAAKDDEVYVIEEKSKEVLALFDKVERQADKCGIGSASEHIKQSNALSGIVRRSAGQLAYAETEGAFRILWFSCFHSHAEHIFELMRRTLYGLENVSVWSDSAPDLLRASFPCYYYYRNEFYNCPWLDATVLWSGKFWALCVNEFSEHVEALRKSSLYRLFGKTGGLQDPQVLEKAKHAFVMRGDLDRTNERAKWDYLRKKYGYRTSATTSSAFVGMIRMPHTCEDEKWGIRGRHDNLQA